MKKIVGTIVLFSFGWKTIYPTEYRIRKMLMLAAPHTSNWDMLFTLAAYWKEGLEPKFIIEGQFTKGVLGFFLKKIGAIGVDRTKHDSFVDYLVSMFNESPELLLLITPEGTKYKSDKWKAGFFNVAKRAQVPLSLGWLDYTNKRAGIGGLLSMTGNFEADMAYIEKFYSKANPKYPERYNRNIY